MKFTVGQLAKIFNISPQSIHSYVEMGILPCQRDTNGYRQFDEFSFQILGTIIKNRNSGFSLKESDYTYTQVSANKIIDKLIEQKVQINDQLRHLNYQAHQLEVDIMKLNRFLLHPNEMRWVNIPKMVRFNLGNVESIKELLKENENLVAKWYSNLFFTFSSVKFNFINSRFANVNFGLLTTYNNFIALIDEIDDHTQILQACEGVSILSTYNNEMSIKQLEGFVNQALVKYSDYCLHSDPYTRLITSYLDDQRNKVNIIELIIPLKKR